MHSDTLTTASAEPTARREVLLELIRCRPALVLELLARLPVHIPPYDELHLVRGGLTEFVEGFPDDAVVLSLRANRVAQLVIVDVQIEPDTDRRYLWPYYAAAARAVMRCPTLLCVVTPRRTMARWAATPIRLGGGNTFQPTVLGPGSVPAVTDVAYATRMPELAVLSAVVHGRGMDQERAARIAAVALQASEQLELGRCQSYAELVRNSLGERARRLLHEMDLGALEAPYDETPPS